MTAQTMVEALGVMDNNPYLFNSSTFVQCISEELFDNDFNTYMDKSFKDIDEDWKTYAGLTINQGQIRLRPGTKKNVRALVQWC